MCTSKYPSEPRDRLIVIVGVLLVGPRRGPDPGDTLPTPGHWFPSVSMVWDTPGLFTGL